MDDRVVETLALYHQRMEDERRNPPFPAGAPRPADWHEHVLLAVGPETGRLLNIIARSLKAPTILELGAAFGYSTIWLAEAARAAGGRVISAELSPTKIAHAREMAQRAGLADQITFHAADALTVIEGLPPRDTGGVDFVLLDLWKDMYIPCLEALTPKLNPGAIIVADNMIHPGGPNVRAYAAHVRTRRDLRSILLPVGDGLEISVFEPEGISA